MADDSSNPPSKGPEPAAREVDIPDIEAKKKKKGGAFWLAQKGQQLGVRGGLGQGGAAHGGLQGFLQGQGGGPLTQLIRGLLQRLVQVFPGLASGGLGPALAAVAAMAVAAVVAVGVLSSGGGSEPKRRSSRTAVGDVKVDDGGAGQASSLGLLTGANKNEGLFEEKAAAPAASAEVPAEEVPAEEAPPEAAPQTASAETPAAAAAASADPFAGKRLGSKLGGLKDMKGGAGGGGRGGAGFGGFGGLAGPKVRPEAAGKLAKSRELKAANLKNSKREARKSTKNLGLLRRAYGDGRTALTAVENAKYEAAAAAAGEVFDGTGEKAGTEEEGEEGGDQAGGMQDEGFGGGGFAGGGGGPLSAGGCNDPACKAPDAPEMVKPWWKTLLDVLNIINTVAMCLLGITVALSLIKYGPQAAAVQAVLAVICGVIMALGVVMGLLGGIVGMIFGQYLAGGLWLGIGVAYGVAGAIALADGTAGTALAAAGISAAVVALGQMVTNLAGSDMMNQQYQDRIKEDYGESAMGE